MPSGVTTHASSIVLDDADLVHMILMYVDTGLTPRVFAGWRSVSFAWYTACGADERLLMRAARTPTFLTKGTFSGLFGLTPCEADQFQREVGVCKYGIMYKYGVSAINSVLPAIAGFQYWPVRIARRAEERRAREYRKRKLVL